MLARKIDLGILLALLISGAGGYGMYRLQESEDRRATRGWIRGTCTVVARRQARADEAILCYVSIRPDHDPAREPKEFSVSESRYETLPLGARADYLHDPADPKGGRPDFHDESVTRILLWAGALCFVFLSLWTGRVAWRLLRPRPG